MHNEVIYGSFCLGSLELAINAHELQDVVNIPDDLIEVPLAPDYFIGVFSLRQSIVPVISMRALLKHTPPRVEDDSSRDCVAIIRVGSNRLGLLFDRTSEVLRIGSNLVSMFDYAQDTKQQSGQIQGVISLENGKRLVQVLDPLALMNLPDVPLSSDGVADETDLTHTPQCRRRCITFNSSGNRFGFLIDAVSEIIPLEDLSPFGGLFSSTCLGQIELRGTKLPVLDFAVLLDGSVPVEAAELNRIVVVKIQGQPVGFKVESVEGITEYFKHELQSLPHFGSDSSVILSGCIADDAADISVIDHDMLFAMPEVTAPAIAMRESNLYSSKEDPTTRQDGVSTTYLVVNLGFDFVLPVAEVSEIIDCPDSVNVIPGAPAYIDGMFNLRKKVITVVNMRALYDIEKETSENEPKLLIVERDNWLIGLRVDGVKDIVKIRANNEYDTPSAMLLNWSPACREDLLTNLVDDRRVLPVLPISRVLDRVSPARLIEVDQAPDLAA